MHHPPDTRQSSPRQFRARRRPTEELPAAEHSWWWHRAPIEAQALMVEAFDEITHDARAVEECKVWLLKQKQTQDWRTTKATADAVYALLLRGAGTLASNALVKVALAGRLVRPDAAEAGTGFYEQRWAGDEIVPELGRVTVIKNDSGVAWGGIHWQYLEDMSRVKAYEGTPLTLRKTLYLRRASERGPLIERVAGTIGVGDELVVRVELRVDRDMEYVHPLLHRESAQGRLRVRVCGARPASRSLPERRGVGPVHVRPGVRRALGERGAGRAVKHWPIGRRLVYVAGRWLACSVVTGGGQDRWPIAPCAPAGLSTVDPVVVRKPIFRWGGPE